MLFSRDPTWVQDVCSREACQCQVHCNRLCCDKLCNNITRVQQARLLASRCCVRFARRPSFTETISKNLRLLTRVAHSTRPIHHNRTQLLAESLVTSVYSQSAVFPYQASIPICGIVHVPALSSRYHSDSISLD